MNRLKELREQKGDTKIDVGNAIGVSSMTIGRWEGQEELNLKSDKAQALADYFKVSVGYLLGYEDNPSNRPLGFDTPEEFEKVRKRIIENNKIHGGGASLKLAYGAGKLTDIFESKGVDGKERLLEHYSKLTDKDKRVIEYLAYSLSQKDI
ncbi:helix-turn-helix transcriptional regulator [Streptococcus canis]|uniref:helix-turn-helix domain-containing protein n=1 Tax=Streptococcus canis TaxID=1329 RepID=UPI0013DC92DE|nr:helix-turn-helix transcriptional regulator [Streptococcus canis]QKG74674.1 helix-turn-helix transcriptional regulator [Streptococcus canis]